MQIVDNKITKGYRKLCLLISTPGGDVSPGLSAYNYLKGSPLEITTHNFGNVDSIGLVLYCAGTKRISVPNARFLMHELQCKFQKPVILGEKQLQEKLKELQIDMGNVAQVVAETVGKNKSDIIQDMMSNTTLYPEEAIKYGLVHKISSELVPHKAEVISIQVSSTSPPKERK